MLKLYQIYFITLITRLRDIFVWPVQRQPILTDPDNVREVSAVATCFSSDLTAHSYRNLKM